MLERFIQVRNAAHVGIPDNFLIRVLVKGMQIIMCRFWRDSMSFSGNKD